MFYHNNLTFQFAEASFIVTLKSALLSQFHSWEPLGYVHTHVTCDMLHATQDMQQQHTESVHTHATLKEQQIEMEQGLAYNKTNKVCLSEYGP